MKKEPQCHICIHKDICTLKSSYLDVYQALNALEIHKPAYDVHVKIIRVESLSFLELQPPLCSHFYTTPIPNQFSFADYCKRGSEILGIEKEAKDDV